MILRPTWTSPGRVVGPAWPCTGRGLPGRRVTAAPVRSYRTISPLPVRPRRAIGRMFLWHFPAGFPGWALPTALPSGVRTFLEGYLPRDRVDPPAILEPVSEPRAAAWRGRGNDEALPASASPHPPPRRRATRRVEVLLAYGEVPRCRRPVGVGGRSGCSAAAQRSARQLNSEPQATQPSACSDRSPQTGQPATPAVRSSPRAPTTTSSSERTRRARRRDRRAVGLPGLAAALGGSARRNFRPS